LNYLEIAKKIAKDAGDMIKSRMDTPFQTDEKSSSFDLVTEVDRASERMIRELIHQFCPDHAFLGEEESYGSDERFSRRLEKAVSEPFLWIVDPIDGTTNFVQGMSGFTVSIALAARGDMVIGVVYDPCSDEMYWAEKGQGTFLNGKKITVSTADSLEQCVIGTGFPTDERARSAVVEGIGELSRKSRSIRSLGSAALQLAYVASGRLEAYWEYGLSIWDTAAGAVLIREAGGNVTDASGRPFNLHTKHTVASNGLVHKHVLDCLKPMDEPGK
jgi:myo-inositol-1(or 4)-monophosphatase